MEKVNEHAIGQGFFLYQLLLRAVDSSTMNKMKWIIETVLLGKRATPIVCSAWLTATCQICLMIGWRRRTRPELSFSKYPKIFKLRYLCEK